VGLLGLVIKIASDIGSCVQGFLDNQRHEAIIMTKNRETTMSEALDWIQQQSEQMADDLETLCNQNSGSEHVSGLLHVADWLVEYFSPLEVPCQRIELPPYETIDDSGQMMRHATGPALRWDIGRRNPTPAGVASRGGKPILLTIHYDTVYEASDSFQKCVRFDPDRMRGPGVIDAKGGIVILRYAALAASKFLDPTQFGLSVVLTPDEEIGSPASTGLWKTIANDFEFALLFEPAMADGCLVSDRKGTGNFVFVVEGKAAHAGRNFSAGRNALVHAAQIAIAIHQLNGHRPNVTWNVGRFRSGAAVNVVPDHALFRVNARVASLEDQAWVESQVQRIVQNFDRPDEGFRVRTMGGIHSPPKIVDEPTRQWMKSIEDAAHSIGQSIRWRDSGGASDGNKLQAFGLANIDTLGPEGDALHSHQEWIDLSSLPRKSRLVYRFLEHAITRSQGERCEGVESVSG
jgi:glutamate carboxypeptidase